VFTETFIQMKKCKFAHKIKGKNAKNALYGIGAMEKCPESEALNLAGSATSGQNLAHAGVW
jgi:hypothetical protein